MTVFVGGHETGLQNTSLPLLNRNDRSGSGNSGHGEQLFVNVSNGNLVIQHQDAFLPSLGDDYLLVRTYNARGRASDAHQHEDARWTFSTTVRLNVRNDGGEQYFEVEYGDGTFFDYRLDSATGLYVSTDGAGAFETIEDCGTNGGTEPSYILTRADQTRLSFDSQGHLLTLEDTNGVKVDYVYEADRLVQVLDDQGHVLNYIYQNGHLFQVTDENEGVLVEYHYESGLLSEVIDRFGHITQYFYTNDGFLQRIVLPNEQVVSGQQETYESRELNFVYDTVNWRGDNKAKAKVVTQITDAQGNVTTFDYDFQFSQGATNTGDNNGTDNGNGKKLGHFKEKKDPLDTTTTDVDKFFEGGSTRVVDALGNNRAYSNEAEYVSWRLANGYYQTYDALQAATNPSFQAQVDAIRNAHALSYTYRDDGYISEVVDQQGFHTTYGYDAQDNLIKVTDRNGWGATRSDSDYYRQLRAELGVVDAGGNGKLVADLTQAEIDGLLEAFTSHFAYDERGNLLQSIDNADNVTIYTYTSFNKLSSSTSAVGNALVTSDAQPYQDKRVELGFAALVGDLTAADTQALLDQHTTYFAYDANQNLIERRDAGGDITRFEYDGFGNLTRKIVFLDAGDLTDPAKQQITTFAYDGFGNNISSTDAEGHQTHSEYDHFGNLIRFTDANGGVTRFTYDADNRLLTATDPEGHTTIHTYDAVGNRISVTDANGHTVTRVYDRNNRLIATLDPSESDPAADRLTQFEYDVVGNRTATIDAEGRRTEYRFNTRRELVEVLSAEVADENGNPARYSSTYAYDGAGNRVRTTDNRGFATEILYTRNHLVRQQTDPNGHITRFEYDANNNQLQIIAGYQLPLAKRQILQFSYDEEDQLTTRTDAEGNVTRYAYDAPGNRIAATDGNGHTTEFEYDGNNRLVREILPEVIDPTTGLPVRYTVEHRYDGNGNEIETIDQNGHSTRYSFDRDDKLVMVEDANGIKTVFEYDSRHNRTSVLIGVEATADTDGHISVTGRDQAQVIRYGYDEFNQLIAETDGLGNALTESDAALYQQLRQELGYAALAGDLSLADRQALHELFTRHYAYDKVGNRISLTDHLDRTTTYAYDALNRLTGVTDAAGGVSAFAYDGNSNRVSQTDAEGRVTLFAYDSVNRLTDSTDPLGTVTHRTYDDFGNLLTETRAFGTAEARTSSFEYDLNNRLIAQTDPEGHLQSFEYDAVGNRLRLVDGLGNATRFLYDALNRNVKIIDPLNFETRFEYDGVGNHLALIDAKGGITRFEYDPGNRQIRTTDAEGRLTTFAFDVRGNRIEQRTAAGTADEQITLFEYDAENNLRRVVDAEGGVTEQRYDRVYNRTAVTDANGHTTTSEFDALNRLIRITDALGQVTEFAYDAVGNRLSQTDALGRVTQFVYDANNSLIRQIAADGVETHFTYDRVGNRTQITRAAGTLAAATDTFVYDLDDRLIAQTDAEGNTATFTYDANHNRTVVTDANGNTTLYSYDANNRVVQIQDPEGNLVRYAYDGNGNRTQVIDGRGFVSTTYFNANNEVVLSVDAEGYATSFVHDNNGNVVSRTLHMQALPLPVHPDALPAPLASATDQITSFEYDRLNRVTGRIDAEGYRTEFVYDAVGNRLETLRFRDLEGTDAAVITSYYDAVDREVAQVSAEGYLTEYGYDAVGNRTRHTLYDQRVILPAEGLPAPAAGDGGRTTSMAYDALNRLVSETSPMGVNTVFEYDSRGNRTAVVEAAGTGDARRTEYSYDAADRLMATTDALGSVTRLFLDGNGNVIESREAFGTIDERLTTFVYDGNNQVISQTDALGVVTEMAYDASGNLIARTSAAGLAEARTETFEYDGNNRLTAQVNGEGERTESAYDGAGNRIRLTLAPGLAEERVNTFEFDRDNRLIAAVDGEGVRTEYRYDGVGNKLETIQAVGVIGQQRHSYYDYDLDNRLLQVTDPMGGVTRYSYDVLGNQTQIVNANGGVQTNTFDALGRLVSSLSAGDVLTVNSYDLRGNIVSTTQSFGDGSDSRTTTYGHDLLDRQIRVTDPEGFSTSIDYDVFGNQTLIIHGQYLPQPGDAGYDAAKAARAFVQSNTFVYDQADRLVYMTDGEGHQTTYGYNAVGNRTSMTEAANSAPRTTVYSYDLANRLVETVTPEGGIARNTYDETGNRIAEDILQSDDGTTEVWIHRGFEYDGNARLSAEIDPYGVRTEYEYDAMGNRTVVRMAAGTSDQRVTRQEYDLNNRPSAEIDGEGHRSEFAHDSLGNRIKVTDALGRVARYYFDGSNNLVGILDAEGTINTFGYDSAGNRTDETVYMTRYTGSVDDFAAPAPTASANDRVFHSDFDGNGRVTQRTASDGTRTTFEYDAAGNLKREVQFANTAMPRELLYRYDQNNRLVEFTDVDGTLTTFTYDGANNKTAQTITSATDPNAVRRTTFEYDLNNRLVRETYDPDGLNLVQIKDYDLVGNVIVNTDANGHATRFAYDLNNRLVRQIDPLGNDILTAYDAVGNRTALTDANGHTTNYVYDGNNRVVLEMAPQVEIYTLGGGFASIRPTIARAYDAAGNEIQTTDAAGFTTTRYFDSNNRLIAEINGDNALRELIYNAAGEQTGETLYMTRLAAQAHDPATRPAAPAGEARTTSTEYDLAGRVIRIVHPQIEVTTLNGIDTDAPTATTSLVRPEERFVYDAFGNRIEIFDRNGNRSLAWYDAKDRLVAQVDPEGYLTEFDYDAQDNVLEQRIYTVSLDPATLDPAVRPNPPAGEVYQTSRSYDAASRLIEERSPLVEVFDPATLATTFERVVTRYTYDGVGNQLSRTLAAGSNQEVTEYAYFDSLNRQVAVIDGNRVVTLFAYDANGNQTLAKRLFNPVDGQIDLTTLDGGTTNFASLVGGNAKDQELRRVYDALNQLSSETDLMGAGSADDLIKSFAYDANGNRTRAVDEDGWVQQFSYDALTRLVKSVSPDNSGTVYEYDAAGNQILAFTGQLDGVPAPAGNIGAVLGDGLVVNWSVPDDAGIQSYVVYDTVSHADIHGYADQTAMQATLTGNGSAQIALNSLGAGDTLYFRIVTKDRAGNLTWTGEQKVTLPPRLAGISVEQTGADSLEVTATFESGAANPRLLYGIPGAAGTAVAFVDQGNGVFKATLSGLTNLQELAYRVEWEDAAGATFTSSEIPFEAQGGHAGISSTLSESTVIQEGTTYYKAHIDTTIPSSLASGLLGVVANWERIDVPDGAVGSTSAQGVIGAGLSTYGLILGDDQEPLEAGTYLISLVGVGEDQDLVLDTFEITLGNGLLSGTRRSVSWNLPDVGNDQVVIVDGGRVSAAREEDRLVVDPALAGIGAVGYSVFYGTAADEDHTTSVTSTEITETITDNSTNPPTTTVQVLGYDLGISVTLPAAEAANVAGEMHLAWRPAGSGTDFAHDEVLTANGNTFEAILPQLPAGRYDLKVYYVDAAGNEVIVDWLRADTGEAVFEATGKSVTIQARETGGRIILGEGEVLNVDPGVYSGPAGAILGSLSLETVATGLEGGSLSVDGRDTGYFVENRYNALNTRIATNAETGLWRTFGVDANGNVLVTSNTGADGVGEAITTFSAFDGRNREIARFDSPVLIHGETVERRAVTRLAYDVQDNLIREISPDGSVTTHTWNALGSRLAETLGAGTGLERTTAFRYDRLGRNTAEIDALGNTQYRFYDLVGNLVKQIDGEGYAVTYTCDVFGRRTAMTNALGQSVTMEYDHRDRLLKQTDGEGNALATSDDPIYQDKRVALGYARLVGDLSEADKQALGDEHSILYEYDGRGNRTRTVDANGHVTRQVWDELGRVKDTITYQNGREIHETSQYDAYGNMTASSDGEGRITTKVYGPFGRLMQEVDPAGRMTLYEYDDQGQMVREWSLNGKDIRRLYDDAGRLLEVNDLGTGVKTLYGYDIAGHRLSEEVSTPAGAHNRSVAYEYDALGQMTRWADAVTGMHTNYWWDVAGNLARAFTDVGYDPEYKNIDLAGVLNQVEATLRAMTHEVTYQEYGTNWIRIEPVYTGNLNEVIRQRALDLGIELGHYDEVLKLRTEYVGDAFAGHYVTRWSEPLLKHPAELYDLLEQMGYGAELEAAVTDPNFQFLDHRYYYDYNNRVTQITQKGTLETGYGYDAAGNRHSMIEGGLQTTYLFDANGRVISAKQNDVVTATWTYDDAGNLLAFRQFDGSGQLTNETRSQYYENNRTYHTYSYDKAEGATQTTTLTLDRSGRTLRTVQVSNGKTFYYDHYYNAAGLETQVTARGKRAKGLTVNTYDVNDHRIVTNKGRGDKMARAEILRFVYNNDGQVLYRFHDTGRGSDITRTEYAYANGHAVGQSGNTKDKPVETLLDTKQYNLVQPFGEDLPASVVSSYTVRHGDTLQSIAAAVYGNPSLWFVLAEANGLDPAVSLKEGQRLEIPNTVKSGRITADTHKVYDEGEILGSTLPNIKHKQKKGCGSFLAIIIAVVIAIVAIVATWGLATYVVGPALAGVLGSSSAVTVASFAIAGAVVGAAASAIQQGLFIAMGYQEGFSWKSVAAGAVSGMFAGAAQGVGQIAKGLQSLQSIRYAQTAARALQVASVSSKQLIENGKITSWSSLAVAAVGPVRGVGADGKIGNVVDAVGVVTKGAETTTTALGTALQYVTPWLDVAESYIRTGEVSPETWAGAVGGTLNVAVAGKGMATVPVFESLDVSTRQFAANLLVGGALAAFDKGAAENYLTSFVGNEIGSYIGTQAANALGQFLRTNLGQGLVADLNNTPAAASASGATPVGVGAARGKGEASGMAAPNSADHLEREGILDGINGITESTIEEYYLTDGIAGYEGENLTPEQAQINVLLEDRDYLVDLANIIQNSDEVARDIYDRVIQNPGDYVDDPLFFISGINPYDVSSDNIQFNNFQDKFSYALYTQGLDIEYLAMEGKEAIANESLLNGMMAHFASTVGLDKVAQSEALKWVNAVLDAGTNWSSETEKVFEEIGSDPNTPELLRATVAFLNTPMKLGTGMVSGAASMGRLTTSSKARKELIDGLQTLWDNPSLLKEAAKNFADQPIHEIASDTFVFAGDIIVGGNAAKKLGSFGRFAKKIASGRVKAVLGAVARSRLGTQVGAIGAGVDDLVKALASSRKLANALEKAGFVRRPGEAAHHLVAGRAKLAEEAREVLKRFDIDIDSSSNGAFLPGNKNVPNPGGAAVHASVHTEKYYKSVNKMLRQATNRQEAIEALETIRKRLLSGGYSR